jgi:UDPglucose 6-dehydrogenase
MTKPPTIGYAGLTHLGLCSAIGAATKGFPVVGFSEDAGLVERIGGGHLPVVEPGLEAAFIDHRARLSFTSDRRGLGDCDVVFVAVDVPTNGEGASDLAPIEAVLARIAPSLGRDTSLVLLSQVPPGFTRQVRFDAARRFYQVETLIFGRALERVVAPERFIIGSHDTTAPLPAGYRVFLEAFGCPVLQMRYESAELAKIAINCFLAASVSTTNTLAELCEKVDADWAEIVPALRLDARIGPAAYLTPGLGIAGGNLERDLATIVRLGAAKGSSADVIQSYVASSRHMRDWAWRTVKRTVLDKVTSPRLGILGLAYKQDTHSTKNSPSLALIEQLDGVALTVHDPVVPSSVVPAATAATAPEAVAEGADAVLLMTPWPAYRQIDPRELARRMRGRTIVDPYRLLDAQAAVAAGLSIYSIGRAGQGSPA